MNAFREKFAIGYFAIITSITMLAGAWGLVAAGTNVLQLDFLIISGIIFWLVSNSIFWKTKDRVPAVRWFDTLFPVFAASSIAAFASVAFCGSAIIASLPRGDERLFVGLGFVGILFGAACVAAPMAVGLFASSGNGIGLFMKMLTICMMTVSLFWIGVMLVMLMDPGSTLY